MGASQSDGDSRGGALPRRAVASHLAFAFLFSAVVNTLFLASPIYMMQLYGRVLDSRSLETLAALSVALVLALIAMAAADAARGRLLVRAASRIERRLAGPLSERLSGGGDARLSARLADLEQVRRFLSGSLATTLYDAPFTVLFLIVLFLLHPLLGAVATIGAAIILASVAIARHFDAERERRIGKGQAGVDMLAGVADRDRGDLRGVGAEGGLLRKLLNAHDETGDLRRASGELTASLGAFTRFVRMLAHSGALAAGAVLTLEGELPAAAMLASAILAGRALGPMETLFTALRQGRAAREALRRVADAVGGADAPVDGAAEGDAGAAVKLHRAMVLREGARRAALRAVSLGVAPGEIVSVAGPTGAGKSTLLRAIAGIEPLRSGDVSVAGLDPARLEGAARRRLIGWMPQDFALYPGTVAENIASFDEVDPRRIHDAARRAGALEAVNRLPQGFATEVGVGGVELSPGVRQLVAFARALHDEPRLLLLDQPTAQLDAAGEMAAVHAIRALKAAGATVIVATHKPVIASIADRILVMRDGAVDLFDEREAVLASLRRRALAPVPEAGEEPAAARAAP